VGIPERVGFATSSGRALYTRRIAYAADRHQERNAREFCAGGAGVWMPQEEATGERILETLAAWAADAGLRLAAGAAAKAFSRPDAAERIVRSALGEIGKGRGALRV
jgi:UDP-N-acetylglucosamine--N-acetylmuramyl-(pentapeptide) pyrophosphoryl-undecaprenol N-acetylglucosamine transferase